MSDISLLSTKNSKIGQLTLRKMIKIGATRCQILRLKCTKFDCGWGSDPDPAGGSSSAPQTPSWIKGPTSKGRGGVVKRGGGWEKGRGGTIWIGGEGKGWEG